MKRIYVDPSAHLARAAAADFASTEWHDLALLAHRLRRDGPTGELLCLSALAPPVPPAAHQLAGAVAIVEDLGGRALLADDEGLDPVGTAALVVREWLARGRTRVLIAAPPSRLAPWREALADLAGKGEFVLTGHASALDLLDLGWDALVVDAAHRLMDRHAMHGGHPPLCPTSEDVGQRLVSDPAALTRLASAPPRLLLVTSTPVRSADLDAEPLLALLGAGAGSNLRGFVVRRTLPAPPHARLAEIVRLEGASAERALNVEAREAAILALAAGGPAAAGWCALLQAAEALPAALPQVAAAVLDADTEAVSRARVLSLLRTAQLAAARSPSKIEALVPLIGASTGRTLVAVASPEAAHWVRAALGARGLAVAPAGSHVVVSGERVRVVADSEPLKADPAAYTTLIHLDAPWDPRRVARRLSRLSAAPELRIFHLALAGSVEEQLLGSYQEALALAAAGGDVEAVVSELREEPEDLVRRAIVRGAYDDWAEALRAARAVACAAFCATSEAFEGTDLSV